MDGGVGDCFLSRLSRTRYRQNTVCVNMIDISMTAIRQSSQWRSICSKCAVMATYVGPIAFKRQEEGEKDATRYCYFPHVVWWEMAVTESLPGGTLLASSRVPMSSCCTTIHRQ